jgi:hypothetical protein
MKNFRFSIADFRFLRLKCYTQRLQENLSRQDAKNAKKEIFLRTWRALRLCARHLFFGFVSQIQAKDFEYFWQDLIENPKSKIENGYGLKGRG